MTNKLSNNLIILLLIAAVVAGGLVFYFSKNSQAPTEKLKAEVRSTLNFKKKDVFEATALGNLDASITVYEFSDFECPFCARFTLDTFPQIKEKYIDTGKVRWVFKNFPLPFHKYAKDAAEAALCSASQEKFWEYHDLLYKNQSNFSENDLKKYGKDLRLNESEFNYCLEKDFYKDEAEKNLKEGQLRSVSGTPTFFIGEQMLVGAQHFDVFAQIIEQQLR